MDSSEQDAAPTKLVSVMSEMISMDGGVGIDDRHLLLITWYSRPLHEVDRDSSNPSESRCMKKDFANPEELPTVVVRSDLLLHQSRAHLVQRDTARDFHVILRYSMTIKPASGPQSGPARFLR